MCDRARRVVSGVERKWQSQPYGLMWYWQAQNKTTSGERVTLDIMTQSVAQRCYHGRLQAKESLCFRFQRIAAILLRVNVNFVKMWKLYCCIVLLCDKWDEFVSCEGVVTSPSSSMSWALSWAHSSMLISRVDSYFIKTNISSS